MSANLEKQLGRRGALVGIGVAAAAVATALPDSVGARGDEAASPAHDVQGQSNPTEHPNPLEAHHLVEAGADVRALLGELRAGAGLGSWRVEAVYDVRAGGIPLVLSTQSGRRFAVEVFRLGDDSAPLVTARSVGLYLVNRGDGSASTDEAAGLGVAALGRALETRLANGAPIPEALTTLSERRARHPTGIFHVPV